MAAEAKQAFDEYETSSKDCVLDPKVFKSTDIATGQLSASYTTDKYTKPGNLVARKADGNFKYDKDNGDKLVSVEFQVVAPAKDDKGDIDPANEYTVTVKFMHENINK